MAQPIRFVNLRDLLNNIRQNNRTIEVFRFNYNQSNYIVILTTYQIDEQRPQQYAQAKLEFLNTTTEQSIFAYADFYEVHFKSASEFIKFFNIDTNEGNTPIRQIFLDFNQHFANFIPNQLNQNHNNLNQTIIANRLEPNSPNTIYCYDIRRNGINAYGEPNRRSAENSEKAKILRPNLYQRFQADSNLSFFFSDNPQDEKTDIEIIQQVARR